MLGAYSGLCAQRLLLGGSEDLMGSQDRTWVTFMQGKHPPSPLNPVSRPASTFFIVKPRSGIYSCPPQGKGLRVSTEDRGTVGREAADLTNKWLRDALGPS